MRFKILTALAASLLAIGLVACDIDDLDVEDDSPLEEELADEPDPEPDDDPEPEPEDEPEPDPEPAFTDTIELAGTGDDVVNFEIPEGSPAIAHFTHEGSSNFQVTAYDEDGERVEGLVNAIGGYDGIRPVNFQDRPPAVQFEIAADGEWTATIMPITEARVAGETIEGTGDEVISVIEVDATTAAATHDGDANFQVTGWGDRRYGMINEIGAYDGRVRLESGVLFLEVVADGAWTFTFE